MAVAAVSKSKLFKYLVSISTLGILVMVLNIENRHTGYYPARPLEIRPPPTETYLMKYDNNYWIPERIKKILVWTPAFGVWDWAESAQKQIKKCKNMSVQCVVTTNRTELVNSSALLFHASDYWGLKDSEMPTYRHPRQVWVIFSHEANPSMNGPLPSHTFNWTMGYRRDSTIYAPYNGPYIKKSEKEIEGTKDTAIDYFSEKTKFAVIHVSNCRDTARRYRIVHELSRYMELDQFGHCSGKIICEKGKRFFQDCPEKLRPYKFYLAFENSYCRDYITEKYWQSQIVRYHIPIVAYSNTTTELLPPHSYINIFDFPNLQAVAKKMIEVGNNKTLYNSYFEWQKYYKPASRNSFCEICKGLHENRTAQSYNLEAWMKHDTCSFPNILGDAWKYIERTLFDIGLW